MIDTIILHIYGLQKYQPIISYLERDTLKEGSTTIIYDKESGEVYSERIRTNPNRRTILFHDSNKLMLKSVSSTMHLGSSHADIAYRINREVEEPRIELNFSIPKAIWHNNVCQFIDYFSQSAESTYKLLMDFLDKFRKTEFPMVIQKRDISINRIDFCYNQFFISKEAKQNYLVKQKILADKFRRNGSKIAQYSSSFMLVTRRESFKVYDKGEEFRAKDYNKLKRLNNPNLNPDKIKESADRILRYESTFRHSAINDVFYKIYIDKKTQKQNPYSYFLKALKVDGQSRISRRFNLYSEWENIDAINNLEADMLKARHKNWEAKYFQNNPNVRFTYPIFLELFKTFWKRVNEFQIKTVGNLDYIKLLIKKKNEELKMRKKLAGKLEAKKISLINEKTLLSHIIYSQKKSLKTKIKEGLISKAGYYKILNQLNLIGLKDFNPVINTAKPSISYMDYKYLFGRYHVVK